MGVKGLFSYIQRNCPSEGIERPLTYFEYKTFIIDVSIYMYKLKHASNLSVTENFKKLIDTLLSSHNKVVLIIDGKCQYEKYQEIQSRKIQRNNNLELMKSIDDALEKIEDDEDNEQRRILLEKHRYLSKITTQVSQEEREELHNFLNETYSDCDDCSICLVEHEEADKKIAQMAKKGRGNVVVMSDDTDMFLYGCDMILMNYNPQKLTGQVYLLKPILNTLDISRDDLIQICVMTGTDYLSPFHENSPLPKISITQMFIKFRNFKNDLVRRSQYVAKLKHNRKPVYTNFIDFMCFVYWKNSINNQEELNAKLWDIYIMYYKT